jgi:4-amino-4-deoxy-L-arabinose transferase-like glycosyltransferase
VYVALCSINLGRSVWFDEAYSGYIARQRLTDIVTITAQDMHPPLYYVLLKAWSQVFGCTDYAMRSLSILFGVVTIVFVYHLVKRTSGIWAGTLCALAISIMPLFVHYGQEMRMYTMMTAVVFAASYVLVGAMERERLVDWLGYGVLVGVGMWIHYFAALVWLAHLAWLVWIYRKRVFQKSIVLSYVVALLLFAPWMPAVVSRFIINDLVDSWVDPLSLQQTADFFGATFFARQITLSITGLVLVGVWACAGYFVVRYRASLTGLGVVGFMAVVPVLLLAAVSVFRPEFVNRYLLPSAVSIVILLVVSISKLPVKQLLVVFTAFAAVWGYFSVRVTQVEPTDDMKAFVSQLADLSGSEDQVILTRWYRAYFDLSFYANGRVMFLPEFVEDSATWGLRAPPMKDGLDVAVSYAALLSDGARIWDVAPDGFVASYPAGVRVVTQVSGPAGLVATALESTSNP